MSTTIQVQRICRYCGAEFTARTTVTRYCSLICNQRAYKAGKRSAKVKASDQETKAIAVLPFEVLKAKAFLSIAEASRLMGVGKRTVYRLIKQGVLGTAKAGTRTILRRSDIDTLFDLPKPAKPPKQPKPVAEFYTVKEVEEKYFVKYGRLNRIIKENNLPHTTHNGRLLVSKPHLDRYFKNHRPDSSSVQEWYTVQEIQAKYGLTRDQVYGRVYDNQIPKQRVGKYVKVSKLHFDELFEIGV
jgi:excisionase family DNA binding protein